MPEEQDQEPQEPDFAGDAYANRQQALVNRGLPQEEAIEILRAIWLAQPHADNQQQMQQQQPQDQNQQQPPGDDLPHNTKRPKLPPFS